jgi:hypothetical protein
MKTTIKNDCGISYDKEIRLPFSFPFNGIEGFGTETSILTGNIFFPEF